MVDDLHAHLGNKLRRLLSDHAHICTAGGMSDRDTISTVISALTFELACGAVTLEMDEESFLDLCRLSHQHITMKTKQLKTARRTRR